MKFKEGDLIVSAYTDQIYKFVAIEEGKIKTQTLRSGEMTVMAHNDFRLATPEEIAKIITERIQNGL